ncbi:uncharacterized protein LOC103569867 [Microplitis demolitor]|uniref:uncharacterized protein LOC103569867 n=1 Tax=Microplitis demolitor TaxID=69319 RepID=UPI0004CD44FF|nr:uncharacterized protein LOC103569867 [Microplitis demolitor]
MRNLFEKLITPVNIKIYRNLKTSPTMAKSKFEYVRDFEREYIGMSNNWIVVRVDGKNFSKFSIDHQFLKPNDIRALELMNHSAAAVMNEYPDIVLAYGQSDEYSFVFRKETETYNRRESKLRTLVSTLFAATYASHLPKVGLINLKYLPYFDSQVLHIPSNENLREYLSWRQADCHINNLYNTCFWNLVQRKNMTLEEAQEALKGTDTSDKNELLFHTFNINYNNEHEMFRKGSTLIKKSLPDDNGKFKPTVITLTCDLIGDKFWEENPQILDPKAHKNKTKGAKNECFSLESIVSATTKKCRNSKTSLRLAITDSEYVPNFEHKNICLPNCWIVVRVDGKKFSKLSNDHQFLKPNDIRALELMNHAAAYVVNEFPDIVLAYGQSDEYSFVFRKETEAYNRRESKIMTYVSTLFAFAYTYNWSKFFSIPLKYPPSFDARVIIYPSDENLRDYLSWRQADVHINNLYNICFWNLVQKKNMTPVQAQEALKGTVSSDKHELLLHTFNINYDNELEMFRKGSTLIKKLLPDDNGKFKPTVINLTCDLIGDKFWQENPQILERKADENKINEAKKILQFNVKIS